MSSAVIVGLQRFAVSWKCKQKALFRLKLGYMPENLHMELSLTRIIVRLCLLHTGGPVYYTCRQNLAWCAESLMDESRAACVTSSYPDSISGCRHRSSAFLPFYPRDVAHELLGRRLSQTHHPVATPAIVISGKHGHWPGGYLRCELCRVHCQHMPLLF